MMFRGLVQDLPMVIFTGTALTISIKHLRSHLRFRKAVKKVEHQYQREGKAWSFWADATLRIKFLGTQSALYAPDDSAEIRGLKAEVIDCRRAIISSYPSLIGILIVGGALTVFAMWLSAAFK